MSGMLAPPRNHALERFGKGDTDKLRVYLHRIAAFLGGRPKNTQIAYRGALKQFFELFDWICPEDVTAAHAAAFKKWLVERRKLSDATAYQRMSALRSFFGFLCLPASANGEPLLRHNVFKQISCHDIQPTPYARSKVMDWPTFQQILDAIPADALGLRDKAILLFFAYTGRRRSEVARLLIKDLNLESAPRSYTVKVKGGTVQTFELPDVVFDAIDAYWLAADRLGQLEPEHGVFTALGTDVLTEHLPPGRPLANRTMNSILTRAIVRAGLDTRDERLCIHAIRHMAARDLDQGGARLQDIQRFLGHASAATTQIYLGELSGPRSAHTDILERVREEAMELAKSAGAD